MTPEEQATIVEVLCSQALADHLGDVRDAELKLWRLIGVNRLVHDHDSAWLRLAGIPLPEHLDSDDEGPCPGPDDDYEETTDRVIDDEDS